ncbi:MAG: toll/interleukin-1 receptor domain-containing protein, partial [Dehalococcoidia bacterium]
MPVEYFVPMVTGDFSKRPPMGKVETRQIFLSHAHADRELALGFRKMLEEAFSGLLTVFISSDPTPTGCLMPGEEWYREIHTHLADSETILVLATLVSIERPWIYWEAGIGKATCPGGVIVVRVGLTTREVLSPVSNFQSYDGTIQGDGGLGELIGKIASQLGMVLSPILVDALAKQWSEVALNHRAEEGKSGAEETRLEREQLNDFGALVARLESTVDSLRNGVLTESTRVSTELVTMVSI